MGAEFNPIGIGLDVEDHVGKIKALSFVLRQLVLAATADTGFAWTDDDRDRCVLGTEAVLKLIDEHSTALVHLAYKASAPIFPVAAPVGPG